MNPGDVWKQHGIIADPNCNVIPATVALKPIRDAYGIKRIVCSTYQAVSGAGLKGREDLENGVNLWVVADNVRKGAATNAVQIARMLLCLQS